MLPQVRHEPAAQVARRLRQRRHRRPAAAARGEPTASEQRQRQPGSQAKLAAGTQGQADAHAKAGRGEERGHRQLQRVGTCLLRPEQAQGQQVPAAAQGAQREQGQQGARDVGQEVTATA